MFTPEKMVKLHVLFSERDVNRVTETVVKQGAMQTVDPGQSESWAQNLAAGTGSESAEARDLRERIDTLIRSLAIESDFRGLRPAEGTLNVLNDRLSGIEKEVKSALGKREDLEREQSRLDELKERLERSLPEGFPVLAGERPYLSIETGVVANANLELIQRNLEPVLHVFVELGRIATQTRILVIGLRRDAEQIRRSLSEAGFQSTPMESGKISPSEIEKNLRRDQDALDEKRESVESEIQALSRSHAAFLLSALMRMRQELLKTRIQGTLRKTERTYLLSGWIPGSQQQDLVAAIRKETRNRCIVEAVPADALPSVLKGKMQVPVLLKNPRFLKPFELLTRTYGLPTYRSLDPTPFLALSFLIMFGVMFGDVGHGLILGLLGGILALRGRKQTTRSGGLILFYAGCSSIVFGFLFGSFFGLERVFPAIWLKPMESIDRLFGTALYFGVGMLSLSMAINVTNGIRNRDFGSAILDKAGLVTAVLYWCCLIVVSRMLTSNAEARGGLPVWITGLMIGAIVILFLREPILQLLHGKKTLFPEGVATTIMGGLVEILEIFLGFLANTVSFIRVAAFGLAHAGLFMAIFALSDSVQSVPATWLILVLGNVLIIGLEGLVVGIQAVRLEFYEFFSRFFTESGTEYKPLQSEVVS